MHSTEQLNAMLTGRYDVEREIGAGGMATVYLARDVRHDRRVALKVLHPDLAAALGAERFLTEIRTTAKLQHPHILPLHDSGEAGGHLFYVMPYVEGETLRARLTRETMLPIEDAVRIAREVLGALDYAHRQGIVHRDVKPENVLLHDGSALIADFGIALAVTAAGNQRMTQTGLSLGTPQYMSPEQATGEKSIDARADIYGMGAVVYEMLVGEPPFSGASVQAVVAKLLTERPTPPTTLRDTIPPNVEAAVLRALAKLPADRFATAAVFADALTSSSGTGPAVMAPAGVGRGARERRPLPLLLLTTGVLGGAALGVGGTMLARSTPDAPVEGYALGTPDIPLAVLASTMTYAGATLSISRDGSHVAWVQRDSGTVGVVVRGPADLAPRSVRAARSATSVALSPNGGSVAFTVNGNLFVADTRAGSATALATRAACPYWSEDDWIYFSTPGSTGGAAGVFRVRPTGGAVDTLYFLATAGPRGLTDPVPIGDGQRLLVRTTRLGAALDKPTAVLDVRSGQLTPAIPGRVARYMPSGHVVYRHVDGNLRVTRLASDPGRTQPGASVDPHGSGEGLAPSQFDVASNGTIVYAAGGLAALTELRWVSREGVPLARLDAARQLLGQFPALSPDGGRVVVQRDGSLWVRALATGATLQLTSNAGNYPAWTPDGKFISYFGRSPDRSDTLIVILRKRADGGGQPEIIARDKRNIAESAWSPDGKWLIYRTFATDSGSGDILGLRVGVDTAAVELIASPAVEAEPSISPNGKWMAYVSDQSGRNEVYVVPFPDTRAAMWPVSSSGGIEPRWSRDGKELFYRDGADNMVSVPITASSTFAFGTPKVLFSAATFRSYTGHNQYDVARDGRFLMGTPVSEGGPTTIVLVKNWRPRE